MKESQGLTALLGERRKAKGLRHYWRSAKKKRVRSPPNAESLDFYCESHASSVTCASVRFHDVFSLSVDDTRTSPKR